MTYQEKEKIRNLRGEGISYSQIADTLGISQNTVKSFCRRNNLGGVGGNIISQADEDHCLQCWLLLTHTKGAKKKRFCSDQCRMAWWNAHPQAVQRKAYYSVTCQTCGTVFESYGNKNRKYCSRACYGKSKAVRHE